MQNFAQCATSEDSALVTSVKEALHEAVERPEEGTPTLNRQNKGESQGFNNARMFHPGSALVCCKMAEEEIFAFFLSVLFPRVDFYAKLP